MARKKFSFGQRYQFKKISSALKFCTAKVKPVNKFLTKFGVNCAHGAEVMAAQSQHDVIGKKFNF